MLIGILLLFFYMTLFDLIMLIWIITFLMMFTLNMYTSFFDGFFNSDFLSFIMVLMLIWVVTNSLLSFNPMINKNSMIWVLILLLFLSFFIFNGLLFYIFFETSFMIMFLFLLSYGVMLERLSASFYMLFYTLVFSLPFLILIMEENMNFSTNYFIFFKNNKQDYLWIFMLMVFTVKMPLFTVHLWLPKAHVEAPTLGSMILAGVLLKLGSYGLIRFYPLIEMFSNKNSFFLNYLLNIGMLGGLYVNLICLRQSDLKMFIAYSSIVHMSLVFISIISMSNLGFLGSIMMSLAHGLISPSLFLIMGFMYNKNYTRSLYLLKGSLMLTPILTLTWTFTCSLNMSVPPFMSFLSEVYIMMSMSFVNILSIFILMIFMFLSGAYCIFMMILISQGTPMFCFNYKLDYLNKLTIYSLLFFIILNPFLFFIL